MRESARNLVDASAAVLVDLDGTLVDSSGPVRRVWTAFAHRHGLDPEEVLRAAHGRPSRETVGLFAPPSEQAHEAQAVEDGEVGDPEGVRALPGAAELLGSGRQLAVVTSCSRALATVRLEAAGLPIPDELVSSDLVEHGKPAPDCFLLGASRLGVTVERCLAIEDAPAGIAAGRAAGAMVLALRTTHIDAELAEAEAIIDHLAAIDW